MFKPAGNGPRSFRDGKPLGIRTRWGYPRRGWQLLLAALVVSIAGVSLGMVPQSAHATSFTSSQSGSWGSSATWGGGGIPACGDDVTISSGHTVTLDTTRCSNNLTINSGGALDLNGASSSIFRTTGPRSATTECSPIAARSTTSTSMAAARRAA